MKTISEIESEKYKDIWSLQAYDENSPGSELVDYFLSIAKPARGSSIIDIGAGAGAASRKFKDKGFRVTAFDLTNEAWAHEDIRLFNGSVWQDISGIYEYAYCCDMMEHIPTQFVGLTISSILNVSGRAFFSVSFLPDNFGHYIKQDLHLTVQPFTWWRDTFRELGTVLEARDLLGDGVFYVER